MLRGLLPLGALTLWLGGCTSDQQVKDAEDVDGDGYAADDDCDDDDPDVHPGATEVCDEAGVDEDCNGVANDADADVQSATTWFGDADGDGYGANDSVKSACVQPSGYVANSGDCNDHDPTINPLATEVCDPADVDEDCDGATDDSDDGVDPTTTSSFWADGDGDGYGNDGNAVDACDVPLGYVDQGGDCDDGDADVNPDAHELCDELDVDEDCDGRVDDADDDPQGLNVFFEDDDDDGYGSTTYVQACDLPDHASMNADDCDDKDADVHPGAAEVCDGKDADEDCDGVSDDEDADAEGSSTWYADADGDGYGTPLYEQTACDQPKGYVSNALDCDDTTNTVSPLDREICNEKDDDCDGYTDDDDSSLDASTTTTWYVDADGDGYGSTSGSARACEQPDGYADNKDDCDDGEAAVYPDAIEICGDGLDNNCDSTADGCGLDGVYLSTEADATIYGEAASNYLGSAYSLGPGGDVNGDGYSDVVTASVYATGGTSSSGEAYVFYGPISGSMRADTADLVLASSTTSAYFGFALASDHDLSGDGRADVVVGAPNDGTSYAGYAYIYAKNSATVTTLVSGSSSYAGLGTAVAMGDVTGDGKADLLVGESGNEEIRVLKGPVTGTSVSASTAWETLGSTGAGYAVSTGDYDGDGVDDVAVGAAGNDNTTGTDAGAAYILLGGGSGGTIGLEGDADLLVVGEAAADQLGFAVALDGDYDGDGYADLLAGAPYYDNGGATENTGIVYFVYGPKTGTGVASTMLDLSLSTYTKGDQFGDSVAYAGDVNGDDVDDCLLAAWYASSLNAGAVYLITGPWIDTDTSNAAILDGVSSAEELGWMVAGPGDVNNDGYADVLASGPGASIAQSADGAVRLFDGGGY